MNSKGREFCKDDFIAVGYEKHLNKAVSGSIVHFIHDLSGKLLAIRMQNNGDSKSYFKAGSLKNAFKSDPNITCTHNVCIGDVLRFYDYLGNTVGRVINFTELGITMEVTEAKFPYHSPNNYFVAKYVSNNKEDIEFSKVASQMCDDISPNDKKAIFQELYESAKAECELSNGNDICLGFKYTKHRQSVWFERTTDQKCRFFGYLKPTVTTPIK